MKTGFDILVQSHEHKRTLKGSRLAYLGNLASVGQNLENSFESLLQFKDLNWTCVLSPQHGWSMEEQANMIPSHDSVFKNIPVLSLYTNETRELTSSQLDRFDVVVVDLQDVGCRVYTFLTTMLYVLNACDKNNKSVVILDRPNPVGRKVEGLTLLSGFESVVGAWNIPMRYGMTLGEIALAYKELKKLKLSLKVIQMEEYQQGWSSDRIWLWTSPNMTDIECATCYSGTVLLEGTQISEGRGTAFPLKILGFPKMDATKILELMHKKSDWLQGCILRPCVFKPTFDKYQDQICSALQIHITDFNLFHPFRAICLFLKCVKEVHPNLKWLSSPPYEYEYEKWPFDILSGSSFLREWIESSNSTYLDLENKLKEDEDEWRQLSQKFYLY